MTYYLVKNFYPLSEFQLSFLVILPVIVGYIIYSLINLITYRKVLKGEVIQNKKKLLVKITIGFLIATIYAISSYFSINIKNKNCIIQEILECIYITNPIAFSVLFVLLTIFILRLYRNHRNEGKKGMIYLILFIVLCLITVFIILFSLICSRVLFAAFFQGGV